MGDTSSADTGTGWMDILKVGIGAWADVERSKNIQIDNTLPEVGSVAPVYEAQPVGLSNQTLLIGGALLIAAIVVVVMVAD